MRARQGENNDKRIANSDREKSMLRELLDSGSDKVLIDGQPATFETCHAVSIQSKSSDRPEPRNHRQSTKSASCVA
jgi:hypothetical protein